MTIAKEPGSFRDPSGFVFSRGNTLYRQVELNYRDEYDTLIESGLYDSLVGAGLLIPHAEESCDPRLTNGAYPILLSDLTSSYGPMSAAFLWISLAAFCHFARVWIPYY